MPDLTNDKIFPTFYTLPTTTDQVEHQQQQDEQRPNDDDGGGHDWYMVAQVKNNMTITKPTLIVTDRSGMDFAVTFEEDRGWDLKARGLKKGNVMVIPRARRLEKGPGRKDVLVVEKQDCEAVKAIPGGLERTIALASRLDDASAVEKCETCEKVEDGLLKCTGCESVAYCGKECQVKGWTELGHKSDCKIFKSIKSIWN